MKELFPASNTVLDWFMCTAVGLLLYIGYVEFYVPANIL